MHFQLSSTKPGNYQLIKARFEDCISNCTLAKSFSFTGVESSLLIHKAAIHDVNAQPPRVLYYRDYEMVHMSPEYRNLGYISKFKLICLKVSFILCSFIIGRIFLNMYLKLTINVCKYFPILAFFRFGIKESFVNIFESGPTDNTKAIPNSEYYKLYNINSFKTY